MSNFKKIIVKILAIFFSLFISVFVIFFLLTGMDEIWDGCSLWLRGVGVAGIFGSAGLIGIIISLAPKRRPPKILFYSLFFFFVIIIVSSFKDTLPLRGHDCYALQQESLNSHVGVPCGKTAAERSTEKWNTYYDERYKYRIDFPSGFSALTIYEHTLADGVPTANGGIVFSPADSIDAPGGISVKIFENSKFQSLNEWLESEKNEYMSRVVEKKINIDGNEAIVTHQAGMQNGKIFEEYKQPKATVFIKDNKLFVITTSMDDVENEKLWNSFKFIIGRYPIY